MASKSRKRRRQRHGSGESEIAARPRNPEPGDAPRRRREQQAFEDPPPAPWGSFPLVELAVFVGMVLLVVGFIVGDATGWILIGAGVALASIAGLELAVREHLAGYRSHTLILSLLPTVAMLALLFILGPEGLPPVSRLLIGLAVFGLAAWGLTLLFRSRSGGYSFRLTGFRRPPRR